jgi:hypothetical protein
VRWAFGLLLVALGCDSFAGRAPALHDVRTTPSGAGGSEQGPTNGVGDLHLGSVPGLTIDTPVVEPEPEPDWCTVARQQGATFCESGENRVPHVLEFCEPAPAAPRSEGGAAGMTRADVGAAGMTGADAGAAGTAGADAGAAGTAGAAGVPAQPAECVQYDRPPEWVHDLLIQCYAHCGVGIRSSERRLEGSCCYLAQSEYYGR